MIQRHFQLTLQEDCVVSERNATEGRHRCLDYIPGSNLLGAVAGGLYRKLSAYEAFTVFHSGQVRFGNARPVSSGGSAMFPIPLSLHVGKGASPTESGFLVSDRVWNLTAVRDIPEGAQPQQIRNGFISLSGEHLYTAKSIRLKTGIDNATGRSQDAGLFGYESLREGTVLQSTIEFDQEVDSALIEQVEQALSGMIRVGRSRSAEYGNVLVEKLTPPIASSQASHSASDRTCVIWLLSDLAAVDGLGNPTLQPTASSLGLPAGQLLTDRSFIRSRRYSPWNAKRGGPDLERQVICQGSVLSYELRDGNTPEPTMQYSGLYNESGLGSVWVNPPMISSREPHPVFHTQDAYKRPSPAAIDRPESSLIEWLEHQITRSEAAIASTGQAQRLAYQYARLLDAAKALSGPDTEVPAGPSKAQWGDFLAAAKKGLPLFDVRTGPCRPNAEGWREETWDESANRQLTFADWANEAFASRPIELAQQTARLIMRQIDQSSDRSAR